MNVYYAKTVLYAYPHIEKIMDEIDEIVERKAVYSMNDCSPCIDQAEKILSLTAQKDALIKLKLACDEVVKNFNQAEKDCLDYKYFKKNPKEYYKDFDYTGRTYFRRQTLIAKKFSHLLEFQGIDDQWFQENCLIINFIKALYKRVVAHEKSVAKTNKAKKRTRDNNGEQVITIKKTA